MGISYSPDGASALVADREAHTIKRIDLTNICRNCVTVVAGDSGDGQCVDGIGTNARLNMPLDVAHAPDGTKVLVF